MQQAVGPRSTINGVAKERSPRRRGKRQDP